MSIRKQAVHEVLKPQVKPCSSEAADTDLAPSIGVSPHPNIFQTSVGAATRTGELIAGYDAVLYEFGFRSNKMKRHPISGVAKNDSTGNRQHGPHDILNFSRLHISPPSLSVEVGGRTSNCVRGTRS
jgi:hypothetical protein